MARPKKFIPFSRNCKCCGKEFILTKKPQREEWGFTCSKTCALKLRDRSNNRSETQCKTCGKIIKHTKSQTPTYCSHVCQPAWNKGLNKEIEPKLKSMGFQCGHQNYIKNHSPESIEKMRLKHKGKVLSAEHRINLSKAHIGQISTRRGITPNKEECERLKKIGLKGLIKQQSGAPTSIEVKLYDELTHRGLFFEKQKLINGKFIVDAYVPNFNLVIEADGDYWHSLERVKKRDKAKNAYLGACGYGLLRLSETEINNGAFRNRLENKIGL